MSKRKGKFASLVLAGALIATGVPVAGGGLAPVHAATKDTPVFQLAENGGGRYTDAYQHVAFTKDGGYVVAGYTMGDSDSPKWTFYGTNHSNNDAVFLKYDKDNKLQWSTSYGDTGVDVFEAMDVMADGSIIAAGRQSFTSSDAKIKGVSWNIVLLDPATGDVTRTYKIGGTAGDQAYGVAATRDGGFVVGGWSASKEGYITHSEENGYAATQQLWQAAGGTDESLPKRLAPSGPDSVVVKVDKDGKVDFCSLHNYEAMEDAYAITSPGERLEALTLDAEENIVLTGYGSVAKNAQNAVIAKLSGKDGALLWHHSAGTKDMKSTPEDKGDYIKAEYMDVTALEDGTYVATGTSTGDATTEQGWEITGTKDTVVDHYDADGKLLNSETFGTIDDNNSRPEGVAAMPDGGYIVFGSQSGIMTEDDLIKKGYDWGSYGAQDAVLVNYDSKDQIQWSENYGTTNGDWINGMATAEDGRLIAVGESNGKFGNPYYENNGGIDGILLVSDGTQRPGRSASVVKDGKTTWADGKYQGIGGGYGGNLPIDVTIENGRIKTVSNTRNNESADYFAYAKELFDLIPLKQSVEGVDTIAGATLSSNGILEGTEKALSKAAASHVDQLITAIEGAADKKQATQAAAEALSQLGTYALDELQNLKTLEEAAKDQGIELTYKSDVTELAERTPKVAGKQTYSDRYYKLQKPYFDNIHANGLGYSGKGVKIAVIDSGLTPAHKDLDYSKISAGWDYEAGAAFGTEEAPFVDTNGHGTAVTGILQAIRNNQTGIAGILSQAEIVPLRVIPKSNDEASSARVAQAINDAVDKYKVDVITTSLDVKDTDALKEAVDNAAAKGVIITGASGNSSKADSTGNDKYIYPAAYDNVVSVGAVDKNGKVRTTSQKNDQVFVTAPGDNIALLAPSRNTRCTISSGTSYASPLVAAMAVAAKQEDRYINVDEFKALLTETSRDAGDEGYDTSYGHGIVDMKAFAAKLGGTRTASVQSYFLDGQSLQLTGLPKDIVDPQVVVSGKDGRLTGMAPVAPDENGVVTLETPAENGQTYTVKITSDNYDISDVEVTFSSEDVQSGLTQALTQAQAAVEAAQVAADEAQLAVDALPQDASAREIAAAYKKLDKANNALAAAQETVSSLKTQQSDLQAKQIAALEKELKDTKAQLKETEKQLSQAKAGTKPSASAAKKANAMKVTSVTKKVKKKKLKKKAVTVAPLTVKGATGTLSFQKLSGKKNLRIDTRTGKVVVAKKTKKGTYTMKVKVTAAGNATTKSIAKTVKVKIKVK